ncbi:diguanylate cyclase/phosphodiesterase (GGDEF & EAL domains) with PAS/PAC sensor(s) [methanotrophic endosymbiont of Bathymodiolus puteoserpentis (Logatchev)]|nr:diguanylate cyclase/phosphodiesterase (GGDEF & EAL domains) with PAS/PAC sensor(s) [methanotrophic endosymbiont of Bathymodiolus puteoserpentis (Logatchev)]
MLFLVLPATLILVFTASIGLYIGEYHRSKVQTERQLQQLIDTVEQTAVVAAYSHNEQIAVDVLKGLLANDKVYKAEIKSRGSFALSQVKRDFSNSENRVLRLLYSPFGDEQLVGQLEVQWPDRINKAAAEQRVISNIIISISLIGITAMVILLLIHHYIVQPLSLASNTLHEIKAGEAASVPILKRNRHDELGRFISDTNNLLTALEHEFDIEHQLRIEIESIEQQLRHAYNASSAGLFLLSEKGMLLGHNLTLPLILHLQDKLLSNTCVLAGFFRKQCEFEALFAKALKSGQLESQDFQLLEQESNEPVWVHCLMSKVVGTEGNILVEGVLFDVSKRVSAEQAIKYEVMHDALTGTLRKAAAQSLFKKHIMLDTKSKGACFLMLDLDGFKLVNDTYGHLAGDKVLKVVAGRLLNCVRTADVVCRLGGDEFLVILFGDYPESFKFAMAEKIIHSIQQPMVINDQLMVNIGVSIGIANFDGSGDSSFDDLLEEADETMYKVKRSGKNGYAFRGENNVLKIEHISLLC